MLCLIFVDILFFKLENEEIGLFFNCFLLFLEIMGFYVLFFFYGFIIC